MESDFWVDTFVIGDSVSEIKRGAFYKSNVCKVVFPKNFLPKKMINGVAWNTIVFSSCNNLEEVVLPETLGQMDSLFFWCHPPKIYVYE